MGPALLAEGGGVIWDGVDCCDWNVDRRDRLVTPRGNIPKPWLFPGGKAWRGDTVACCLEDATATDCRGTVGGEWRDTATADCRGMVGGEWRDTATADCRGMVGGEWRDTATADC